MRENEQGAIAITYREQSLPFTEIPASTQPRREGALPPSPHPHPRALRVLIQEAQQPITLGEKLAANENSGLFRHVKTKSRDISIVDKPGTLLMWYDILDGLL